MAHSNRDVNIEDDNNSHNDDNNKPLLLFSSIAETPLDSTVIEKPYTVILMEDEVCLPRHRYNGNDDTNGNNDGNTNFNDTWIETFRSKIPREHGMSFASISLNLNHGGRTSTSISDGLQALKASQLSSINDALLVARGPMASLCAQYYLESFSLQGLIMIDPILVDDDVDDNNDDNDNEAISSLISRIYDGEEKERFRSTRLLVEPNAVPMMIVLTVPNDDVWNRASRFVAARHGAPDGPYGVVPVVDLTGEKNADDDETEEKAAATIALDPIIEWIDETL